MPPQFFNVEFNMLNYYSISKPATLRQSGESMSGEEVTEWLRLNRNSGIGCGSHFGKQIGREVTNFRLGKLIRYGKTSASLLIKLKVLLADDQWPEHLETVLGRTAACTMFSVSC